MKSELLGLLKRTQNLKVNEIVCGGANGSMFLMHLENNIVINFYMCPWRIFLRRGDVIQPIVSSSDSLTSPDDQGYKSLKSLEGDCISEITINKFNDIEIVLNSGILIHGFSAITNSENESYDNWLFSDINDNYCYAATTEFNILRENYR